MTWQWPRLTTIEERKRAGREPLRFFVAESLKRAAMMSLLLAVAEWIWPTISFAGQPGTRLYFIVFTSVLTAGFQFWLARLEGMRSDIA